MNRYVSEQMRRLVIERANSRCEYCFFPQRYFATSFHIEHIIALKHGGETVIENLALACSTCNEFKGSDLGSLDWDLDGGFAFFFNPRTQILTEHFRFEENGTFQPLTAEARVTARLFKFNDEERVEERLMLIEAGLF
jgi:HNH endonuclease